MDELLDKFFKRLEFSFQHEFSRYIVKSFRSQRIFLRSRKEAQRKDFGR